MFIVLGPYIESSRSEERKRSLRSSFKVVSAPPNGAEEN
jgi:hypothetical protein